MQPAMGPRSKSKASEAESNKPTVQRPDETDELWQLRVRGLGFRGPRGGIGIPNWPGIFCNGGCKVETLHLQQCLKLFRRHNCSSVLRAVFHGLEPKT